MQAPNRITAYFESPGRGRNTALMVLGLLIIAAYSNSFQAAWHMDDYPNILRNPAVQMQELDHVSLKRAMSISRSQGNNLPRPVTNLTFAFNWWLHGDNVAGYRLVNIAIHFFNALLVFLIVKELSARPVVPGAIRACGASVALVTALLWALNPIQTQAVTYVVQRYTSLATLFFLVALYCFIRGRAQPEPLKAYRWWSTMLCAFLLSLGSKENAALWPASVLLVEWVFFQDRNGKPSPSFFKIVVAAAFLSLMVIWCLLSLFQIDLVKAVLYGFDGRPFSLAERVMTQPRVLVYYLSQIFYPIPQRLSLEHDFTVSTSLLHPWTTLPAMLTVGLLAAFGLIFARKRPVFGFAILFFLINHLVESTVLPLEMVFEHRNYLPSLFLFWPLVTGGFHLQMRLHRRQSPLQALVPATAISLVLIFAVGTLSRNMDWRTERSLWVDTFRKAPQSARAAVNLANDLARNGHYEQAAELYTKATTLQSPAIDQFKVVARSNLAIMYQDKGERLKALDQWTRVLNIVPHNRPARQALAELQLAIGQYDQAEAQIDWLLKRHPRVVTFLNTKAALLIRQNRPRAALVVSRRALAEVSDHPDIFVNIGVAQAMLGHHARADWFFRRALRAAPHDLGIQLVRLENSLEAGRMQFSKTLIARILGRYPLETVWARLDSSMDKLRQPVQLRRVFTQHLEEKAQRLEYINTAS